MSYRDRVAEIVKEQPELKKHIEELQRIYTVSLMEEGLLGDHEVSDRYKTAIEEAQKRFNELSAEYESIAPCAEFEKRYGQHLHDVYREKYPINTKTRLEDLNLTFQPTAWNYVIPNPHLTDWEQFAFSPVPPMSPHLPMGKADFEQIGNSSFTVCLAYAPEINTVFVGKTYPR